MEKVSVATAISKQGGVFQHSHNTRRSQSTLKVLSADFRKDALGKTQVKTSIESERREYKAKIGVGLGLQAHSHSTHPNPQSKKAKDKTSHKRNLHKDISTKTSPQTASRVNQKNPMEKISQRSHSRLQTERNISAQPQSKMFSKCSQPTLKVKVLSANFHPQHKKTSHDFNSKRTGRVHWENGSRFRVRGKLSFKQSA